MPRRTICPDEQYARRTPTNDMPLDARRDEEDLVLFGWHRVCSKEGDGCELQVVGYASCRLLLLGTA